MVYVYILLVLQFSLRICGLISAGTNPHGSSDLASILSRVAVLEQTVSTSEIRSTHLETVLNNTIIELQATKVDLERTKTDLQSAASNLEATKTELQSTKSELALKTKDIAFQAYSQTRRTGNDIPLQFYGVNYNAGNGFNTTTGKFTAPVSGTYILMTQVNVDDPSPPKGTSIQIVHSHNVISDGYGKFTSDNHDMTITATAVTYMKQGEQAWVTSLNDILVYGGVTGYTIFVGALLSAH